MNKKIITGIATFIILSIILIPVLKNNKEEAFSATNYYLGTVNTITVYSDDEKKASEILEGSDNEIKKIDNLMSTKIPGSDIYKINKNAGISPVKVSDQTINVIKEAVKYSDLSSGNFDVSIGPISDLWAIGTDNAKVPSDEEINSLLPLVDYKKIELDEADKTVYLPEKGMKLDLGAIAKGYAADIVNSYLDKQNVENAIINLGGNIYAKGVSDNGENYDIGLKNPIEGEEDSFASVKISNKSVVTSGVYERYTEKDGKKYHHILNPFNGYPYENNLLSVTIISDRSINCDALSTSAFALGVDDGLKLIESIDGVDAVFVKKDKEIYITDGFESSFNLLDDSFRIVD